MALGKLLRAGLRRKVPLQFSSDLQALEVDIRLCHRRARELSNIDRLLSPVEICWLERKLSSILEALNDGEEPT